MSREKERRTVLRINTHVGKQHIRHMEARDGAGEVPVQGGVFQFVRIPPVDFEFGGIVFSCTDDKPVSRRDLRGSDKEYFDVFKVIFG